MTKHVTAMLVLTIVGGIFFTLLTSYQPDTELNTTAQYYAESTATEVGAANIVTAIIVTYRGLDTLGEVTVLFLTAAIVGLALAGSKAREATNRTTAPVGELLSTGSRVLIPLILLLGAYVFINGHLTPGGGFQGGAIVASGLLLSLLANPAKRFSHRLIGVIESFSGLTYTLLGIVGIFWAGGFLDNRILPLGEFGALFSAGAIPVIYSLIGLKVGAEFSSIISNLSETEEL